MNYIHTKEEVFLHIPCPHDRLAGTNSVIQIGSNACWSCSYCDQYTRVSINCTYPEIDFRVPEELFPVIF